MEQMREVAGAVQVALKRLRGDLATLEQAVTALTGVMDEDTAFGGRRPPTTRPIRNGLAEAHAGPSWDELSRALGRGFWFPTFGALLPSDDDD